MRTPSPRNPPPPSPLRETAGQARHLLAAEYAIMLRNETDMALGLVEPLHDYRVALRRLRTLLRTFRALLPPAVFRAITAHAQWLSDELGQARDADVWLAFAERPAVRHTLPPGLRNKFAEHLAQMRLVKRQVMRTTLSHRRYRETKRILDRLVYQPWPAKPGRVTSLAAFARQALRDNQRQIMKRHRQCRQFTMEEAHALRKACRRGRYLCDFFAPWLGPQARHTRAQLLAMQNALGKVHDCDTGLAVLHAREFHCATRLMQKLKARRRRYLAAFHQAWRQYHPAQDASPFAVATARETR